MEIKIKKLSLVKYLENEVRISGSCTEEVRATPKTPICEMVKFPDAPKITFFGQINMSESFFFKSCKWGM